jgi:hypothetical protein
MKLRIYFAILPLFFLPSIKAQSLNSNINCDTAKFKFRAVSEIGFASVLAHHIQLGQNGTYFDYVKDGGQDVLFQITRFSLEMDVNKRSTFILLYQPLVSYLNGSDNEIVGAILDASMWMGAQINESGRLFINLRYLGGGATGTDTGDVWPGDGYVKNWPNFLFL